jgi:hypothetical protein
LLREHLLPAMIWSARLAWLAFFDRRLCRPSVKRAVAMLAFLPAFVIVQCLHWLGFLLDEILFPRYRKIQIREPLFIVGPPRTGTTLLHRTLAQDHQFTTLRTWELFFALSITERRILRALARLDRRAGGLLARTLKLVERRALRAFDDVHGVSLNAPEEDYFALTPIAACFLLVIPFPCCEALWRLSRFDHSLSARDKRRILSFYALCLQKHLYVYGAHKRLLSKNSSFSSWTGALREAFPDCQIVCCLRDPAAAVPSLLNSVQDGLRIFDIERGALLYARMTDMMRHYYQHLLTQLPSMPAERHAFMELAELHRDLRGMVAQVYQRLELPLSPAFETRLQRAAHRARAHRSPCAYNLQQFGLDRDVIHARFGIYYRWRREQARPRPAAHDIRAKRAAHQ